MRPIFLTALLFPALLAADLPDPPVTLERLQAIQDAVRDLFPAARPAVVAILTGDGTASGVIIDKSGLVLTAAHVAETPGRELRVVLEDGRRVTGTTLGLDKTTDAALLQLNDTKRDWPHAAVSRRVIEAQPGEWCFALGHPGGFDKARGVVLRVGRIIRQTANSLQTDCVLMGGDSGGPLFNLKGEVIGIHSQIWEKRDENMHVSMAPFLRAWDEMKSSLVIRTWGTGSGGYLGLAADVNPDTELLEVLEVLAGSPSEKAGVLPGESILALDGEPLGGLSHLSNAVKLRAAGDQVRLRLKKGGQEREVSVTLGHRPKEEG
ncbi:MAG TPA: trypsin-like peptidase domain-containing protein [Prosthecobacter sp.]|nr:trypsin-like peptidase domain-containing protein [Prosthecobacter sp.]HRK14134.1 trypsin-like peptidase domain-containing protein [Prosthecobacter sp.]